MVGRVDRVGDVAAAPEPDAEFAAALGREPVGDDGRVHLYVTEWMNNCPMTYPSFLTQTQIVHVVGETADGPFVRAEDEPVVVPVAAGNPVPAQAPVAPTVAVKPVPHSPSVTASLALPSPFLSAQVAS